MQQGAASSVMCSYATINGTYACENPTLLNNALGTEFGFPGFVTSDWGATHSTVAAANAGLDQEMPGRLLLRRRTAERGEQRAGSHGDAEQHGQPHPDRDVHLRPVRQGAVSGGTGATVTMPRTYQTAATSRRGGQVLLKNSGNVLPLNTDDHLDRRASVPTPTRARRPRAAAAPA